ncbi:hypothetical protein ACFVQ4_12415 [Streptomyces laurentii]
MPYDVRFPYGAVVSRAPYGSRRLTRTDRTAFAGAGEPGLSAWR